MTHDFQLLETQRAFDSVAAEYDGPLGNNALVAPMRAALWRTVLARVARGGRLIDVGCGTGIDAAYFGVQAARVGAQELGALDAPPFDAIYSDLGPLNCAPDLRAVARACAGLLKPDGLLIVSAIGRFCPWEIVYYAARGNWARATVRRARATAAIPLNGHTVWTRYYTPREFYQAFAETFTRVHYRALNLFLPPPYLIGFHRRAPRLSALLGRLDESLDALPLLRDAGDHFLMVLRRRD